MIFITEKFDLNSKFQNYQIHNEKIKFAIRKTYFMNLIYKLAPIYIDIHCFQKILIFSYDKYKLVVHFDILK